MTYTYVKLPTGDLEIEYLKDIVPELRQTTFTRLEWKPLPALADKKRKSFTPYVGQDYDPNFFEVIENGWTHDDCAVCFRSIASFLNEYTDNVAYYNGDDWVCKSCYHTLINVEDFEKALNSLPQYEKADC